jgi:4-amino-4-deoxy-L-arabinose transferase-like glycosyltransferase
MWLFGISQHLIPNPFFAARLVSVILGFLSMTGVFMIGKRYVSLRVAVLAAFLYIIVPVFSFYDRQALMESAVGAVGIWALWFALQFWKTTHVHDAVYEGLILGVGFFIKSSSVIFLFVFFGISCWLAIRKKQFSFRPISYGAFAFLGTISLMLLQPKFWQTLGTNTRYGFGFWDVLHFPIVNWVGNIVGNSEIGFLFLTPAVFLAAVLGFIILLRRGSREQKLLSCWIIGLLVLQTLLIRSTSQRYLVSYLPPLTLVASFAVFYVSSRWEIPSLHQVGRVLIICFVPLLITLLQVFSPIMYFNLFSFSRFSEGSYVSGWTSGFGVSEAIRYIEAVSKKQQRIFVGESLYTGTPESAVMVWFEKNRKVTVGYLDRRILGDQVDSFNCLQTDIPVYFLSKDRDVAGLEKFLENLTFLKNPYNTNKIGIWKVRTSCEGKAMKVRLTNIP